MRCESATLLFASRFRVALHFGKCDMISERIKEARLALKLSQPEASAKSGIPIGSLRKYEQGSSQPGADSMLGLVRLGINANWLLTGEGPMLLADLVAPAPAAPSRPVAPRINVDALAHAYAVTLQTAPRGETLAQTAKKAVAFYQYCFDNGLITEDGEGSGNLEGAA